MKATKIIVKPSLFDTLFLFGAGLAVGYFLAKKKQKEKEAKKKEHKVNYWDFIKAMNEAKEQKGEEE